MPPSFSQAVSMILRQWAADWISPARSTALHPASSDPLALSGLVDRGAVSKPLQKGSPSEKLR